MKRLIVCAVLAVTVQLFVASGFSRTVFAQSPPKQAVIETSAGTFVIDLTPDTAPNQTAYFIKTRDRRRLRRDDLSPHDQVRHGAGR